MADSGPAPARGAQPQDRAPVPLVDEPTEYPVLASERVFEGKVWDLRRETFDLDGTPVTRDFVDHTGAVGILALDADDRALLIQQYRHPVRLREWEIPAGLLDIAGEDPLEAAKRELAEEADLEADEWSVLADVHTSPGGSDEGFRIFLARGLRPTATPFERSEEEAQLVVRWVPLDDCVDAVLARRISNAELSVAVLAAQASRARGWTTLAAPGAPWASKAGRQVAGRQSADAQPGHSPHDAEAPRE